MHKTGESLGTKLVETLYTYHAALDCCGSSFPLDLNSTSPCSGPVVLLRLELGVVSRGKAGPVELVSEYIRHKQLEQVGW